MAHLTAKRGYSELAERINRFPLGAPPSETLFKILSILMTEKEAALIAQLPIKPFTPKTAAVIWKMNEADARKQLEALASRVLLLDIIEGDETYYILPPPMAGFFEFSMMRTRGDIDQELLGKLFHQYMNVEEDFIKNLFVNGETQLGRTFVNETMLSEDNNLYVYDYERATEVIKTASHIGISMCYCRHKMEHMNKACDAEMDICMTFNNVGASLIRHGFARQVDISECMDLLDKAYEQNLVQFGENSQQEVSFICNCCGCCCEALIAARKFGIMNPVHSSNFIPQIDENKCTGCGKCAELCPIESMTMVSANDPHKPKRKKAKLDERTCIGCGVCLRGCSVDAMSLKSREKRVITPVDGVHKTVMMAVDRGNLQDLIFDNRAMFSHRAMAAVLGAILNLPPVKKIMATEQVKSRYLLKLIEKSNTRSV
ncbi:MAG: (Fe-S)-binding protein [Denitrovibrio sp.]|nr:MAG: (Fe-S)-binding protein [Denitrovibrio sp.]